MITTQIIADNINPAGDRITTGIWTYPRFIHSEVMTHRMLAKNAASSRAIPAEKMVEAVQDNPAMFEQYGVANKGMSAAEEMDFEEQHNFKVDWLKTRLHCVNFANYWKGKAAKQLVNRALEPWMHMTIIITGTDWNNFFALRAHPAAQPEFQVLAYRWLNEYLKSDPIPHTWGDWHLPLIRPEEDNDLDTLKKISVARCARVSYTKHDQVKSVEDDVALHDRMLESGHMSPFEHQAQALAFDRPFDIGCVGNTAYFGCFKGWKPYRKFLPNENRTNVNLQEILNNKPEWITL